MTSRITFNEAESIKDILAGDNFRFVFNGRIPGASKDVSKLEIKVNSTSIPGIANEAMTANIGGYALGFRGRVIFPGVLPITFFEDSKSETRTILGEWHEFVVKQKENVSQGDKEDYSLDCDLYVFDHRGIVSAVYEYENLFIQDISEIPLSTDGTAPVMIQASFKYDQSTKIR